MKSYQNWKMKEDKKKAATGLIGLKNGNVEIKDVSQHLFERKTFRDIPYEDMADVEDQLADYMMLHCLTDDDGLTDEGIMCETILNKLGNLD